jgi:rhamnan synthesis protein F/methyltransferase family protein
VPDQTTVSHGFPEGIVRPIAFEIPDRLTDVTSWHGHIPFAFWIVEALRPRMLVELGTHKGDSYCAFAQAVAALSLDAACYAVDTWQGDEHAGLYGEEVFEELRHYHEPRYGRFSQLIRSSFDDAAKYFAEGSIDLLHIDGLHTYEAVAHDFERWRSKLSNRAVVLFHDIDVRENQFGVWRFWTEVVRDFPSFTFHHSHGLGMLAVGAEMAEPIKRLSSFDAVDSNQVRLFFSHLGKTLQVQTEAAAKISALARATRLEAALARTQAAIERDLRSAFERIGELTQHIVYSVNAREFTEWERDHARAELQQTLWERDHARAELEQTRWERDHARAQRDHAGEEREQARSDARIVRRDKVMLQHAAQADFLSLRRELDALWNSVSWRISRPIRNLARRGRGLDREFPPNPGSHDEALRMILAIRQSISWELTAPLRIAHHLVPGPSPEASLAGNSPPVLIEDLSIEKVPVAHAPASPDPAPPPVESDSCRTLPSVEPMLPEPAIAEVPAPTPEGAARSASSPRSRDFRLIEEDSSFEAEFFLPPYDPPVSRDRAIELFIKQRLGVPNNRKPCGGFNSHVYAAEVLSEAERKTRNPFAHFIERGKPPGRWLMPLIKPSLISTNPGSLRTALHVHAYYPDLVGDFLEALSANSSQCDLFVTTTGQKEFEQLKEHLASYERGTTEVCIVPNRGRDLGPFLSNYNFLDQSYDLVGHVHFKKSPHAHRRFGELWRDFLWRNLIGPNHPMLDVIAASFASDPALGLVFPDDPYLLDWSSNKALAILVAHRMNLDLHLPDAFDFPSGLMFWCRPAALRPLFDLKLSWDEYPTEPVPIDGTILHAIERMLPLIAEHEGYRVAATHVPGVTR